MQTDLIKFIRRRDYQLLKELGKGACGSTVLLFDDLINENFVCKKFTPYSESDRGQLFEKFVRETKILHQLNHENVVRVFNYYLYPDSLSFYDLSDAHSRGKSKYYFSKVENHYSKLKQPIVFFAFNVVQWY